MSLNIFHIPPGAKEQEQEILANALNNIKAPDYSSVYIISPTRHILSERKQFIHRILGPCYIPPVMMTISQLTGRIYETYGNKSAFPKELMAPAIASLSGIGIGYATLAAEFIVEIKHQLPNTNTETLRNIVADAFEKANVPEEVSKRAAECLDIMDQYNNHLSKAGLSDPPDMLTGAAELAPRLDEDIHTLILDGFYELTPSELNFVQALAGIAHESISLIPITHPDDDLTYCYSTHITNHIADQMQVESQIIQGDDKKPPLDYFAAKGIEEEVEYIARHIKANYLNSRNRDLENTWIVFPELKSYRAIAGRVLKRYGIPHKFSAKPSLAESTPCRDLLSLLESLSTNFPRMAFARVLTSRFFTNIPDEIQYAVPSLALSTSLAHGLSAWQKAFENKGLLNEFNAIKKALSPLLGNSPATTYSSLIDNLLKVLEKLGFNPGEDVLSHITEALGSVAILDKLCPKAVSLQELTDAFRRTLNAKSTPSEGSGVRVAEIFEVRGLEPKTLYLGGLKDGDIPAKQDMDFILPDRVRNCLGLVDMRRYMHLQGQIFRRLTSAAKKLYLSYPAMEGDKLFLPSILLAGAEEKDLAVKGFYSEEERLTAGYATAYSTTQIQGVKFDRQSQSIRVTDIDAYRSCPRRYFIERVLGLSPPELAEYEVEARALGIIAHKVMEKLIVGALPNNSEFRKRAENILDRVLPKAGLTPYLSSLIRESFLGMVDDIYEIEMALEEKGHCQHENELDIKQELDGIKLKGKIDRIDHMERDGNKQLAIIDYKTGSAEISGASALRGENLQMFIYAAMLAATSANTSTPTGVDTPQQVGIYSLKDLKIKWVPNAQDLKKGNDLQILAGAARRYLKESVSQMAQGLYPSSPQTEQRCRRCHERPYCPYIHGSHEDQNG